MTIEPTYDIFREDGTRICSIADALEVVGDRWSLLVVREIDFGVTRFNDIQLRTGAPRQILAARLKKLEDTGVIERRAYSDNPPRFDYLLTPAGYGLRDVLTGLRAWGRGHAPVSARGLRGVGEEPKPPLPRGEAAPSSPLR